MAKIVAHKEGYLELTLRQGSADANASNIEPALDLYFWHFRQQRDQ